MVNIGIEDTTVAKSNRKNSNEQSLLDIGEIIDIRRKSNKVSEQSCGICGEPFFDDVSAERPSCAQDHIVCNECLVQYLKLKIKEGKVAEITCPCLQGESKCRNMYTEDQIIDILGNHAINDDPEEMLELSRKSICVTNTDYIFKYKKFLFNHQVDCNPNLRWCPVCSKKKCESEPDLSINRYERDLKDLKS